MLRNRSRNGSLRNWSALLALGAVFSVPVTARSQTPEAARKALPRPPTIFDLDHDVEDPEERIPPEQDFQNRWRRIWGALGMRYHLYPSQQTGPDSWPPHPYAGGMNYSIWRNPVTGWPEF